MVPRADAGPDADPGRSTCCEILPKLRTLPRATPRPAESLRIADLPWITPTAPTGAPRLTIKVCPGVLGDLGRVEVLRSIHDARNGVPSRPGSPRLPEPPVGVDVSPGTVAIRRPAPRIARNPGISGSGIPHPGAVHERVPACAYQIGLPHHPVAGNIVKAPVVVQVAGPVTVRRVAVAAVYCW